MAYIDCQTNYGWLRFSGGEIYGKDTLADLASRVKDLCLSFYKVKKRASEKVESIQLAENFEQFVYKFIRVRCAHIKEQTLQQYKSHARILGQMIPYSVSLLSQDAYGAIKLDLSKID